MSLDDLYGRCVRTPSDIWEHLPTLVRNVEELDAIRVIELGVRHGVSTIAWLYALRGKGERGEAHLWSVDCSFPTPGPEMPDVNLLDPQGPLGVIPWWTFILGYDNWPAVIEALPDPWAPAEEGAQVLTEGRVDIVFIDTQHTYEQTKLEIELYRPFVRPGGRMIFHDTAIVETGNAVTPQPPYPVRTAIEGYVAAHGLSWTNEEHCNGLGTIFIP